MLNCHQATILMSEAQDRELSRRERWSLGMHKALCGACRRFQSQVTLLGNFSRGYLGAGVPPVDVSAAKADSSEGRSDQGSATD